MKEFDRFSIDYERCRDQLAGLRGVLDAYEAKDLKEREHVLSFFRENRHLAALVGHLAPRIATVDSIAYEFDFFGDYAADLALGDSKRGEYCFVEFENAALDSIFKKAGRKNTTEWAPRFDHGYSQIIDWFWKLHDLAESGTGRSRFVGASTFDYHGVLVVGRSRGLSEIERKRLEWRRKRVLVDSRHIHCTTYDELYDDLRFLLERMMPLTPAPETVAGPPGGLS